MPIRVAIAEDNVLLRDGLARLISSTAGFDLVGTCLPTTTSCWPWSRNLSPTSSSPTSACRRPAPTRASAPPAALRGSHPDIGVVVLSQYVDAGVRAGAAGRGLGAPRLPAEGAGRRRRRARRRHPAVATRRLGHRPEGGRAARHARRTVARRSPLDHLTPREREILGEMAQGKSNAAIAASLFLSRARRREAHQLDLLQAGPDRGARRQPPGQGGPAVPHRRGCWPHPRRRSSTVPGTRLRCDHDHVMEVR